MIISIIKKHATLHKFYKLLIYNYLQKIRNLQKKQLI